MGYLLHLYYTMGHHFPTPPRDIILSSNGKSSHLLLHYRTSFLIPYYGTSSPLKSAKEHHSPLSHSGTSYPLSHKGTSSTPYCTMRHHHSFPHRGTSSSLDPNNGTSLLSTVAPMCKVEDLEGVPKSSIHSHPIPAGAPAPAAPAPSAARHHCWGRCVAPGACEIRGGCGVQHSHYPIHPTHYCPCHIGTEPAAVPIPVSVSIPVNVSIPVSVSLST